MIAGMVHPPHTGQKAAPNLRMDAIVARRGGSGAGALQTVLAG